MKTNKYFVRRAVSLAVSGVLLSLPITSMVNAETIWSENFDAPEQQGKGAIGSIIDVSGITTWSIDISQAELSATSDWFQVTSQQFEARDVDGAAIWLSQAIDISGKSDLTIELDVSTSGTFESTDYFDLEYSIDGSDFIKVTNYQGGGSDIHTLIDDINSVHISHGVSTGNSIQIRLSMVNNAGTEYTRFDNVMVNAGGDDGGGGDPGDGGGSGAGVTFSGQCYNCPDVTTIADAAAFDDADYYSDVISAITAGDSADQIHDVLNGVLQASHHQLTYSEVWTALTQTDEDPANTDNVILIYRGNSIEKMSNGSGSQSNDGDNWNREHVWAKSHGFPSSSQYAYTDIHHLRPSDISVNASRGNLDFDFSDAPLAEAPENRVDGDSFEPRDVVKGDVARMALYMDVRYDGDDGSTPDLQLLNNLTSVGEARLGKLCSLLEWHQADPIDEYEQRRNNRIYEFQGNRNPFVDHPEWVDVLFNIDCSGDGGGGGDPGGDSDELFFSEYVEGSGYNKALEIFNPTSDAVDLSSYSIAVYANGSATASSTYQLSGSLSATDAVVIVNNNSAVSDELKALADHFSSVINFNGDDYVELLYGESLVDNVGTYTVRENWGKDKTIIRRPEVTQGDSNRDDAFDLDAQWITESKDDFSNLGSHNGGSGGGSVEVGLCGEDATPIYAIQGSGDQSPMVGEELVIEGIVTHVAQGLQGYYVQQAPSSSDNDVSTSDAVFVYHNGISEFPTVGHEVRVLGSVNEYYDSTQLSVSDNALDCGEAVTITPVGIALPIADMVDWEPLEGMLVSIEQSLVVTNTYDLGRYGQLTLSSERLAIPTNQYLPNSVQAIALASSNERDQLILDDQSSSQYPTSLPYLSETLSYLSPVRLGDSFESLVGVIDYSYGDYRLFNTELPLYSQVNPRPVVTTPELSQLRIASMNVLNYFNGDGNGGGFPTSRGADSQEEFDRQHAKIISAISGLNADVIGLMEIENDGYGDDSAVAQLVAGLNENHGEAVYQFVNAGGTGLGTDQITVALVYRSDRVELMGSAVTSSAAPFDFGNRQPLAQTFKQLANGEELTIAVNHFKSKGSCSSASGDNQDQGDGQGCWNAMRVEAATGLSQWLATSPTGTSDTDVLIIGDINAYAKEDPITMFGELGFANLVATYGGDAAYSYSFSGEMGYLDHALANASLAEQVDNTQVWHINADEARVFDYNLESKSAAQIDSYFGDSAYRSSDHDPIVIDMTLSSAIIGDFDDDGDIDINDVRAFYGQLRAGQSFSDDYDFNHDGVVNSRDVRALMTLCTRTRCAIE